MLLLMRFWRDHAAATAIEYAMIAAGISVIIIGGVNSAGTTLKGMFNNVSDALSNGSR